jgi:hypothetical protein
MQNLQARQMESRGKFTTMSLHNLDVQDREKLQHMKDRERLQHAPQKNRDL